MANSDYNVAGGSSNFTPLAELALETQYLDRTLYLGRANFPRTDSLKVGMAALCDDEFMQVTALGPGTVAVKRGTADTVPAKHGAGALIWFIGIDVVGSDGREYTAGQTTGVKYSPYTTGGGSFPLSGQAPDSVTYNWRYFRPYPPGSLFVNSDRWYVKQTLSAENTTMQLQWTHRDRRLQADQLIDHDVTNIGPEPGTTYTVRIYNAAGELKRTEVGIMAKTHDSRGRLLYPGWQYTWTQAMLDLGFNEPSENGTTVDGKLTLFSTRDGFDSWQGYEIEFSVDTQGKLIKVAQLGEQAAQAPTEGDTANLPPMYGVFVGQLGEQAAQKPSAADEGGMVASEAMYVAQLAEDVGQETSFYTPMNRNLFETPYAIQLRRKEEGDMMLTTVVARPSDRLTDSHSIFTRYDYPVGTGVSFNYDETVHHSPFTPWITLAAEVAQLDTVVKVLTSSFYDGVALTSVKPGQVAMVGAEMVEIVSVAGDTVTIKRGCLDTVPARQPVNARMWFFEAASGDDRTNYPHRSNGGVIGAAVEVKMVPDVYGPPLSLLDVPTDRLDGLRRVERPYPPGRVTANGKPWFLGAIMVEGESVAIRWEHRNRIEQGAVVIDHLAQGFEPEDGQKYRLWITVTVRPRGGKSYDVGVREEIIDGTEFVYTWEMAQADGYRAGSVLGYCGYVTVGLQLESIRDELSSWQNYVIPMRLPSFVCAPGQAPGGGQLPPTNGNGNGDVGNGTPGGSTPGSDNQGDGPSDPIDNGGSGDNGDGPPLPPEPPPGWPDPVEPPPVDPNDPNPALAAHWDTNWDRHWDAYTKDNQGE